MNYSDSVCSKIILRDLQTIVHPDKCVEHKATIESPDFVSILYFKIRNQENLHQALQPRAEAFILALLIPAMQSGHDLVSDTAIDEELLYGLNTQLIPYLASTNNKLKKINVHSPTRQTDQGEAKSRLSILGMSCGLDALTAFAELSDPTTPKIMRPQALIMNNIGAFEKGIEKFHHDRRLVHEFSLRMKLPLFIVESNMGVFYNSKYTISYSIRNAAAAWALGDICQRATYASGVEYPAMGHLQPEKDISFHEPIIFPMMSTRAYQIYSSGFRHSRSHKFEMFLSHRDLHAYLNTCLRSVDRKGGYINCGTCKKCAEIIFQAEALDATQNIEQTFNLKAFEKHRNFLEFKLVYNANKHDHSKSSADTLACLREHKKSPSWLPMLLGRCFGMLSLISAKLAK